MTDKEESYDPFALPFKDYEEMRLKRFDLSAKINAGGFFLLSFKDFGDITLIIANGLIIMNLVLSIEHWAFRVYVARTTAFKFNYMDKLILVTITMLIISGWLLLAEKSRHAALTKLVILGF